MVIRGNSRGNARQLGHYLLAQKDNEAIRIFDVDGMKNPQAEDIHRTLFAMGVSEELSKSRKGLYHAQINPAPGEVMDDKRWFQAADILGEQLGLENQRRAIVLHTKRGRTHAHVVWERYDYNKGKMVSDSFSRLAQDRARMEMEREFNHKPTPHRNKHRPELKAKLTELWEQTSDGTQFIAACKANDYLIAAGSGRSPYVVVDENGRSYDLSRQLKGVKLKDVRNRLRNEDMLGEKDAIIVARSIGSNSADQGGDGKGKQNVSLKPNQYSMSKEFSENKSDITKIDAQMQQDKPKTAKEQFSENKSEVTGQKQEKTTKEMFAENKEALSPEQKKQQERERRKAEFEKEWQSMQDKKSKDKDRGLDMG